jgi:hypothetical protein
MNRNQQYKNNLGQKLGTLGAEIMIKLINAKGKMTRLSLSPRSNLKKYI